MAVKSTALFFNNGNSDKEYHASIEKSGTGYVVNYAYGRRGTTLNTGTKTNEPVSQGRALGIYGKLVKSKEAKGYIANGEAAEFAPAKNVAEDSGMSCLPQLLNPISDEELKVLLWDDIHGMMEKKNGHRRMAKVWRGEVEGSNKKGQVKPFPQEVVDSIKKLPNCELDGELVGNMFFIFDTLSLGNVDTYDSVKDRYEELDTIRKKLGPNAQIVPMYFGGTFKSEALERFRADHKEGVVFKNLGSKYNAGRPNSGGAQLKYKFYDTCSTIVHKVNKQRSVQVRMHDGTTIGNVTIPPNHEVPKKDTIVEVRYLFYNKGGAMEQAVYLGVRDDVDADECTMDQLKEKGE